MAEESRTTVYLAIHNKKKSKYLSHAIDFNIVSQFITTASIVNVDIYDKNLT